LATLGFVCGKLFMTKNFGFVCQVVFMVIDLGLSY
jgi:hypothetical protein